MSILSYEVKASYAFIERNFYIVRRYWAWELVWVVYSVVNSLSVSYIGMGMQQLGGQGWIRSSWFCTWPSAPSCGAICR